MAGSIQEAFKQMIERKHVKRRGKAPKKKRDLPKKRNVLVSGRIHIGKPTGRVFCSGVQKEKKFEKKEGVRREMRPPHRTGQVGRRVSRPGERWFFDPEKRERAREQPMGENGELADWKKSSLMDIVSPQKGKFDK